MTNLIDRMKKSLYDFALKDIKVSQKNGAPMGAFILASCLIDCLAGFRYGISGTPGEVGENYKNFINTYFEGKYDGQSVYKNIRCKLVHNYSEGGGYYFSNTGDLYHNVIYDGKTNIILDNFIQDLELAMNRYFTELISRDELQSIAKDRMDKLSLIEHHVIQGSTVNASPITITVSGSIYGSTSSFDSNELK